MPINIHLRSEGGKTIHDAGLIESGELPAYDDDRYPYPRLIDPSSSSCSPWPMAAVEA